MGSVSYNEQKTSQNNLIHLQKHTRKLSFPVAGSKLNIAGNLSESYCVITHPPGTLHTGNTSSLQLLHSIILPVGAFDIHS